MSWNCCKKSSLSAKHQSDDEYHGTPDDLPTEQSPLVYGDKLDQLSYYGNSAPLLDDAAEDDEWYLQLKRKHEKKNWKILRWLVPRLLYYIPFFDWISSYSPGKYLLGDLVAGLSVGIMLVPQGLAYSFLARVPPIYGLYTAFFPLVVYVIFGNSKQLSIGPEALIAILVEDSVLKIETNDSI